MFILKNAKMDAILKKVLLVLVILGFSSSIFFAALTGGLRMGFCETEKGHCWKEALKSAANCGFFHKIAALLDDARGFLHTAAYSLSFNTASLCGNSAEIASEPFNHSPPLI